MNRIMKKLLSLGVVAAMTVSMTIPAFVSSSAYILLKDSSVLTVDNTGSGYIRGIWGTVTAGELASEFEGSVEIRRGGTALSSDENVAADDTVCAGEESYPVLIYGDANRDGRINLADISAILKTIAKWDTDICETAADVTMSGKCDLSDASTLLKWIAGWDITLADAVFPPTEITLDGSFKIVIPKNADTFEKMAADELSKAIDYIYGTSLGTTRITDDTVSADKEILIGSTARSRTAEVMSKLGDYSWAYSVPTDSTVIITGDDSIATYEAVQAFVWDLFGYVNKYNSLVNNYSVWNGSGYTDVTTSDKVSTGTLRVYDYTPTKDTLTIGGRDISEYNIVSEYPDDEGTQLLHRAILRETGISLDCVEKGQEGSSPAILLDGDVDGVSRNVFAIASDGDDIVIDTENYDSLLFATRAFVKWYIEKRLPLAEGEIRYGGVESNLLTSADRTDTVIADGVTYSEILYSDIREQPVKAYLVTVEDGAERIIMGTPDNGTAVSDVKATVLDAINAAEADGFDIAAGINADFFHIESDYSPQGLCVKDGVILKQNTEVRPWIAVMKDGTLDCGIAGEARSKIADMKHGFGVSHILLKNGIEYQLDISVSFSEIRHPRTAMGYDSDGTVYLLVVDGRQPKLSNGATLLDLAMILKEQGADHAVNLDGGGSSTMIVDEGGFVTKNSPSDGSLRKIFNSVLITK